MPYLEAMIDNLETNLMLLREQIAELEHYPEITGTVISKYFLCIFRNEIPPIANIKLNLLFIYNNFLQYSTKNTNFVLVKILFYEKKNTKKDDQRTVIFLEKVFFVTYWV